MTAEPRIRSVVAVEGHPDDSLACLGTLIKLRDEGTRITIVSATSGDQGTAAMTGPDNPIAATRFAEGSAVAKRLGGEFVVLGAPDGYLYDSHELRDALTVVLRNVQPDVVLAPPPVDYHFDHTVAGKLAFTAVYHAVVQPIQGERMKKTPALYYYDATAGVDFAPSFYVDVTEQWPEKLELTQLYASQMILMKSISGQDLVHSMEIGGRYRGMQASVEYAEAFQSCLRWPRHPALNEFPF